MSKSNVRDILEKIQEVQKFLKLEIDRSSLKFQLEKLQTSPVIKEEEIKNLAERASYLEMLKIAKEFICSAKIRLKTLSLDEPETNP